MPQEKNQTQQEATVISSQAKLSTHLNQVSENSRWINIHTLLLL